MLSVPPFLNKGAAHKDVESLFFPPLSLKEMSQHKDYDFYLSSYSVKKQIYLKEERKRNPNNKNSTLKCGGGGSISQFIEM